jgi:hypothetical protein
MLRNGLFAINAALGAGCVILLVATCRPEPGRWKRLCQFTDGSGERFVVAQEHYDWVEGWRIALFSVKSNREYGALLQMETGPWSAVSLAASNGTIRILRAGRPVGTLNTSNRVFTNYLNSSVAVLSESADKLQGQPLSRNPEVFR